MAHKVAMDRGKPMGMDGHYAEAVLQLRQVGAEAVADRLMQRGRDPDFDRTSIARAIMAAVDAVDCRRAAVLDPVHARRWQAIAEHQAQISRAALALQRVEVER